jgi:hypothetical protein
MKERSHQHWRMVSDNWHSDSTKEADPLDRLANYLAAGTTTVFVCPVGAGLAGAVLSTLTTMQPAKSTALATAMTAESRILVFIFWFSGTDF